MSDPCDKAHVFLAVTDFGGDLDLVTSALGLPPTEAWRIGDPHPRTGVPRRYEAWIRQSPLPLSASPEEHLEALLDLLEGHAAGIRDCASRFSVELGCAIYYQDFAPGLHFSPGLLQRIAALGLALDLDLYFLGEDDSCTEN